MSNWKLLVNGGDQPSVAISQIVQSTLGEGRHQRRARPQAGRRVHRRAARAASSMPCSAAIGNIQKFPTRVATNSIYRTANNPVLGNAASASRSTSPRSSG